MIYMSHHRSIGLFNSRNAIKFNFNHIQSVYFVGGERNPSGGHEGTKDRHLTISFLPISIDPAGHVNRKNGASERSNYDG